MISFDITGGVNVKQVLIRMEEASKNNIKNEAKQRGMTIQGLIMVALREYLSKK